MKAVLFLIGWASEFVHPLNASFSLFPDTQTQENCLPAQEKEISPQTPLYGILYQDSTHWTVWFSPQNIIHSNDPSPSFGKMRITEVQADKVRCVRFPSKSGEEPNLIVLQAFLEPRKQDETLQ